MLEFNITRMFFYSNILEKILTIKGNASEKEEIC